MRRSISIWIWESINLGKFSQTGKLGVLQHEEGMMQRNSKGTTYNDGRSLKTERQVEEFAVINFRFHNNSSPTYESLLRKTITGNNKKDKKDYQRK